jgi:Na+-transporting NADH:ubiquinone oxidoreductase subunit C
MAQSTGYIIGFAAGICVLCSLGVAASAVGLRPMIKANEQNALQKKVLNVVGLEATGTKDEVNARFEERLKLVLFDPSGNEVAVWTDKDNADKVEAVDKARAAVKGTNDIPALNPVYLRMSGDAVEAYALEMTGQGLWGPLAGYLALEPDGKTILSVAFDAPKETPGLGAEILKAPFRDQWKGKLIIDKSGKIAPIDVKKGSAALACPGRLENCVDGVSGATITSNGVDTMLEDAVRDYSAYLTKIQSGRR